MTIAQIKALFQTGKIPTQADFENLISKIPNSESTGGGGDNTLSFSDPNHANVLGYRFVTINDKASYLFIGFYDAANATYVPYIIVHCDTGSPSQSDNTPPIKYTILTSRMIREMLAQGGELYSANDEALVGAIPSYANWNWVGWYDLSNRHRVIKNDRIEEHLFITIDGSIRAYFRMVTFPTISFPIISEVITVKQSVDAIFTIQSYVLISIADVDTYIEELNTILNSTDLEDTQLMNFINKYMNSIIVSMGSYIG